NPLNKLPLFVLQIWIEVLQSMNGRTIHCGDRLIIVINVCHAVLKFLRRQKTKLYLLIIGQLVRRIETSTIVIFIKTTFTLGGKHGLFITYNCIHIAITKTRIIIAQIIK